MAQSVNSTGLYGKIPVTIAAGQSLSAPVSVGAAAIVAIEIPNPNAWTASTSLTFQAATDVGAIGTATPGSPDPTQANYNSIYDKGGNEYTVTIPAITTGVGNGCYTTLSGGTSAIGAIFVDGTTYIKVRSGTKTTPVAQTNAQTINLITRSWF